MVLIVALCSVVTSGVAAPGGRLGWMWLVKKSLELPLAVPDLGDCHTRWSGVCDMGAEPPRRADQWSDLGKQLIVGLGI